MASKRIADIALLALIALAFLSLAYAVEPSAPTSVQNISTDGPAQSIGSVLNTSGGTITTVNIESVTQNPRWKGFVGNVSGRFSLQDSDSFTLYDWTLTSTQGEIYATRNETLVDWNNVYCATAQNITNEQDALGFLWNDADTVNRTFNYTSHRAFYAGDTAISADSCQSTFLYVNSTSQIGNFTEVLLHDQSIIYTGLIENSAFGFKNGSKYDYQIIVPDNTNTTAPDEIYYLYIELI